MWNRTKGDRGFGRNPAGKGLCRPVRANLRKERRRRNTFRVGHTETPQMPSFHNRLLPSAPFLSTRRISSSIFTEDYACLLPPLHITPPYFTLAHSFSHHPALRGVSLPLHFFPLFWPSHASSVTTLFLPLVSRPPYIYSTFQHPSQPDRHCFSLVIITFLSDTS